MPPESSLITPDIKQHPASKNLSIEIESSPPFILDVAQLFRAHQLPDKAVELCRLGLNNFPGDLGLRLGMALGYLDLKEEEKAWGEISAVARELNQLAPTLEIIAKFSRKFGQAGLSEWFTLLSQVLAKYPEALQGVKAPSQPLEKSFIEDLEVKTDPIINKETPPSPPEEIGEKELVKEVLPDSKVLSTLNDWLSQLKA